MPGGPKEAYDLVEPIFIKCAAQVESTGPCAGYLGPVGAGNYVKMVHNGIEYGDMQLIAEVYDVLKNILHLSNEEMADVFDDWNKGELSSYLIEITSKILRKKDDQTGEGYLLDFILDKTGMKGTGKWTIQEAADKGVAAPTMAAALDVRMLSARKDERLEAEKLLNPDYDADNQQVIGDLRSALYASGACSYSQGLSVMRHAEKILSPPAELGDGLDKQQVISDLGTALYASKVCSYAQGLSLIRSASDEYKWNVDLSECARLWTGGCIIRAKVLDKIQRAFSENPQLPNLLIDKDLAVELNENSAAWRRVVSLCVTSGIGCPSLCGSLTYFDTYRRGRLPANLTQAQRDFFGGHTFERTDKEGRFHAAWTAAHMDIGDTSQRTAGENLQTNVALS